MILKPDLCVKRRKEGFKPYDQICTLILSRGPETRRWHVATWGDSAAFTILADQADFSPAVLDAVPCLIAVVERESGDIVQLNRALEDVSGCSTAELSGRCWEEIIAPGDVDTMRAALLAPTGPVSGVETGLRTRSGEGRRVLWSLDSAGVTNDGTELVVLSGIDVTPELRTSGLFSQLMRTTAAPALVGTDVRGRVTLYNSAAEKMLGRSAASMIGRQFDVALFDAAEF